MGRRRELAGVVIRQVLIPVAGRLPAVKTFCKRLRDLALHLTLLPFARSRPVGGESECEELLARTGELNRAAEQYYATCGDRRLITGKPFSEPESFAKRLFDMGVLFWSLRVRPGDTVAELGAGTCWLSHFLNRYGCRTIAVDVSATAIELGRELFRQEAATRWDLEPRFHVYDGRRLPIGDETCDSVVVYDAFHHVPNQRQVLRELWRILKPDGRVAMCEPGLGHAQEATSRREVERSGVLERDIVVEDLARLAAQAGFSRVSLIPISLQESIEIPAADLGRFLRGRGAGHFWGRLGDGMVGTHYLVMYKGLAGPSSRRPHRLEASIQVARRHLQEVPGCPARLRVRICNRGDTLWLAGPAGEPGWTRLGIHLCRASGEMLDPDWLRFDLPHDVPPAATARLEIEIPSPPEPGEFCLVLDLVVEGTAWFEERGSRSTRIILRSV